MAFHTFKLDMCSLPGSVPTCGVQFMSRGRGRSAEQSGASAGCCRCENMIITLHHFKQILTTTFTATTPWRHTFNANILRPSSFTPLFFPPRFSSVTATMTFRKFVFRFPPLSSNIQLALHHFPRSPSRSIAFPAMPSDCAWQPMTPWLDRVEAAGR